MNMKINIFRNKFAQRHINITKLRELCGECEIFGMRFFVKTIFLAPASLVTYSFSHFLRLDVVRREIYELISSK